MSGKQKDLGQIYQKLIPVSVEWIDIGIFLGIDIDRLKRIESDINCHGTSNSKRCLLEMLNEWLKQADPSPTWGSLVKALENIDRNTALSLEDLSVKSTS